MKKMFSVFLVFATFFIISCGGLLGDNPKNNTVRFTLPSGNARAASAGGIEDVSYYNVSIANQNFTNVTPGTTVESAQMPVGTSITVTVEAIGKIRDDTGVVSSNKQIAYYQTTQSLPAEGLTLSINLSEYKTSYHKVTTVFNYTPTSLYVADGKRYTPSIYQNIVRDSIPYLHTGWTYTGSGASGNGQPLALGQSVTITSDTTFSVQEERGIGMDFLTSGGNYIYGDNIIADSSIYVNANKAHYIFSGVPFTLPRAKKDDGNDVEEWTWNNDGNPESGRPGQVVTITNSSSGCSFTLREKNP